MTEIASSANVNAQQVTNEQVDKFFASQGNEGIEDSGESNQQKEIANEPNELQDKKPIESNINEGDEGDQDSQHTSNYKRAMQEEREKRKEIQRELQETKNRTQRMEYAFQQMLQNVQQQQAPQPPSYEENPLEALRYDTEQTKSYLQQQHLAQQQQYQLQQQQMAQQQFIQRYQNDSHEYMTTKAPDFRDAYSFLANQRLEEYKAAGYSLQEANRLLIEDEMAIAAKAYNDGVNPADRMYKLAQHRGYKPASQQGQQKIDQLERGTKAAKSLSNTGGKSEPAGNLTLEQVASMSDDELNSFISNPKDWAKLMKKYS